MSPATMLQIIPNIAHFLFINNYQVTVYLHGACELYNKSVQRLEQLIMWRTVHTPDRSSCTRYGQLQCDHKIFECIQQKKDVK